MRFAPIAMLPKSALTILRELGRHILRRPVIGVVAAAHTADDQWLLVRRADTGTWGLPGGTLEWGETLRDGLVREVAEETGARVVRIGRVTGVYSRPDRDDRFHAVNIVLDVEVDPSSLGAVNPLEVREVKLFSRNEIPHPLAYTNSDFLRDAMTPPAEPVFE